MSTSKARFQSNSVSTGASKPPPGAKSSVNNASKRAGGNATTMNNATAASSGKTGPVQVIFNGKIVTPQSLVPKKPHHSRSHHDNYVNKKGKPLANPQTIDETVSETTEKMPLHSMPSKAPLRNRADTAGNELRMGSKIGTMVPTNNKNKAVVEETATVILRETSTQIIFSMPSFIVASDTRDVMVTDERNARYEACVKAHQGNVDGFSSRLSQTKNNQLKNQNEMATANTTRECGSQAISYEIKDDVLHLETSQQGNIDSHHHGAAAVGTSTGVGTDDTQGLTPSVRKFVEETVGVVLVTPGCLLDTTQAIRPLGPGEIQQQRGGKGAGATGGAGKSSVNVGGRTNNKQGSQMSSMPSEGEGEFAARLAGVGGNKGNSGQNNSEGGGERERGLGASASANQLQGGTSRANQSTADSNFGGDSEGEGVGASESNAGGGGDRGRGIASSSGFNVTGNGSGGGGSSNGGTSGGGGGRGSGGGYGSGPGGGFTEEDSEEILRHNQIQRILSQPMLLKRLHMIERAIQQNANYRSQLDYRDLPDIQPLSLLSNGGLGTAGAHGESGAGQLFGGGGLGKSAFGLTGKRGSTAGTVGASDQRIKTGASGRQGGGGNGELHSDASQLFSETSSVHSNDDLSSTGGLGGGGGAGGLGGLRFDPLSALYGDSKVKKLFLYSNHELVGNRAVTCMVWNTVSSDLLAVGYGRSQDLLNKTSQTGNNTNNLGAANPANYELTDEAQEGLVLFWSLRNPDYPEKILRTNHSVTALDFSKVNPMTLAVGLSNGDVNIYDVKREGANWQIPIETSAGMSGAHLDPVWQVKWVVKGQDRTETLVSISTDGRVLEWNLKKGMMMSTLMQLKKSGTGEGWISNSSAGLCFDFNPVDPSCYITGTEDGSLHRCSVSYNEQYLETYQSHEGPVYRVKFSSKWSQVFLTGSADWSMNLYHLTSKTPLLSMRATSENFPIADVCWCPGNSTVFACVTIDAKVQIWDLSVSSLDPAVTIDAGLEDERSSHHHDAEHGSPGTAGGSSELKSPMDPNHHDYTPASPTMGASRFMDRFDLNNQKEELLSPMAKLLKNLANEPKKRILTTVLFGEKNPILVVGDNKGNVTVYRVFEPVTINHLGPLQQYRKLKEAVMRQTDPGHAAMLMATDQSNNTSQEEKQ